MSPITSTFAGASARAFGLFGLFANLGDFELIETQTVGAGGAASVTFGSGGTIPQTYKHLQIRGIVKQSSAGGAWINTRLNGVSASNSYAWHEIRGNGASATSAGAVNDVYMRSALTVDNANFGALVIDILDYTNTSKNKTIRTLYGEDANGSGNVGLTSGVALATTAVTSVTFMVDAGTMSQYSTFSLYGAK